MFYVRTGDRLQRTSTWRENLEGGLDYLKQVVVDDKLGIAAELEADMQRVVDTYAASGRTRSRTRPCARASALRQQRGRRRQRRVHAERGQMRPATPKNASASFPSPSPVKA
jgi:nitrite reductase (NADH) large subunit